MSRQGLAGRAIRYSGLPWLIRRVWARRRASIVLYHDPDPETFEAHLRFLSRHYNFVSLDAVVDALYAEDWSSLPDRPLVVTLDDGHARNRRLVAIAEAYGLRPTIFLCTQIVGTQRGFWFYAMPLDEVEALKRLPWAELQKRLVRDWSFEVTQEGSDRSPEALSREDLDAIADRVDFGSHTRFHPILPGCDETTLETEVAVSKREVEALTGRACDHFAYPNGNFGEREVEAVRRAGYRSARSIEVGWTRPGSDPYRLKITGVSDDASVDTMVAQLSGIPGWLRSLRPGPRSGDPLPKTERPGC
ncbi:MAG: polysaccharide deacetylase family protein [Myxococcota bacterium]